jgi:hypothetical protein
MSARLSSKVSMGFTKASDKELFFSEGQNKVIIRLDNEQQPLLGDSKSCKTNLYFGFFFDGTKNNYIDAEKTKTHSNIARHVSRLDIPA